MKPRASRKTIRFFEIQFLPAEEEEVGSSREHDEHVRVVDDVIQHVLDQDQVEHCQRGRQHDHATGEQKNYSRGHVQLNHTLY